MVSSSPSKAPSKSDGFRQVFWSWLGAFSGIGILALLQDHGAFGADAILLIGSFGASAVLVYCATDSPLAQPRNLLGGHLLSAVIGVACFKLLGQTPWLAEAVSVATAIALMQATGTVHPPGGATALIAVIGSDALHDLGFFYALVPVGLGAGILLLIALCTNRLAPNRQYPKSWW